MSDKELMVLEKRITELEKKVDVMAKILKNDDEIFKCHKNMIAAVNGKVDATIELVKLMGS